MTRNRFPDDRDTESILSGHAASSEWSAVASVIQAIGSDSAAAPVRVGPELAQVLALGLPPTAGSSTATPPPASAPLTRRSRMIATSLLTKLAALGITAKVGIAAAATGAVVITAGAAGALPSVVQDPFASFTETVTPFDVHDSHDDDDDDVDVDDDDDVEAPEVEESEEPDVDESDEPDVDESDEPDVDESDEPDVDESDEPEVDESDAPDVDESESPSVDETDEPAAITEATDDEATDDEAADTEATDTDSDSADTE